MAEEDIACSLCKGKKKGRPLDTDDPILQVYTKIRRLLGIQKLGGRIGICNACMINYTKMRRAYESKLMTYGIIGLLIIAGISWLTGSIVIALLFGLFILSLAVFSYCPPLVIG